MVPLLEAKTPILVWTVQAMLLFHILIILLFHIINFLFHISFIVISSGMIDFINFNIKEALKNQVLMDL